MNNIDITEPTNFDRYVSDNNYISYQTDYGIVSYHIDTPVNGGCGWWREEHFKVDECHIKMEMDGAVLMEPPKNKGW